MTAVVTASRDSGPSSMLEKQTRGSEDALGVSGGRGPGESPTRSLGSQAQSQFAPYPLQGLSFPIIHFVLLLLVGAAVAGQTDQ